MIINEEGSGMQAFLRYTANFDPGFATRIRGATESEIAHLERCAGVPLPSFYREFLTFMGHNDDGLLGDPEPNTDISAVIEHYEDSVAHGEDRAPDGCVFIGIADLTMLSIGIECEGTLRVFEMGNGKKYILMAEAFEKLLYQFIYSRYRHRAFSRPCYGFFKSVEKRPVVAIGSREAMRLGFTPQWFSDSVTFCAEREDAILLLMQFQNSGLCLRIIGEDPNIVRGIAHQIANVTGVKIWLDSESNLPPLPKTLSEKLRGFFR